MPLATETRSCLTRFLRRRSHEPASSADAMRSGICVGVGLARDQFVSDIFQEVDEEVRREQLKKLWDRYGVFVVAAAVHRGRGHRRLARLRNGGRPRRRPRPAPPSRLRSRSADGGKHSEAEAAFAKIVADGTPGYRHLARLREAAELATYDRKAAIAAYEKIAGDGAVGPVLQDLAALRAAALHDRCRRLRPSAAAARAADRARPHVPPHRPRIARAGRLARRRHQRGQALVRHDHDRRANAGRYPLTRRDADGARPRSRARAEGRPNEPLRSCHCRRLRRSSLGAHAGRAAKRFDPTDIFSSDMFDTKKKLPGDRRAVFPEGTPGVSQGVPQELVKGYQPPAGAAAGCRRAGRAAEAETEAQAEAGGEAGAPAARAARRRGDSRAALAGPAGGRSLAGGPQPQAVGGRAAWPAAATVRASGACPDPPSSGRADCVRAPAPGIERYLATHVARRDARERASGPLMSFTVAIVGRPNVGKSTLFNRLVGRRLALVDDRPGVTRDRREGRAQLGDLAFTVIDTAGLDEAAPESLTGRMQAQTEAAIAAADAVFFLIDARAGPTPADRAFADLVRRSGKPAILIANKSEGRAAEAGAARSLRARPRRAGRDLGRARRGACRSLRGAARGAAGGDRAAGRRCARSRGRRETMATQRRTRRSASPWSAGPIPASRR